MGTQTVTVIDIAGIQQYIFSSNNLKHIIGASGAVHAATHNWVFQQLPRLGNTNVQLGAEGNWTIQPNHENLISEVIYAGGGNVVILFTGTSDGAAREFTKAYTKQVLQDAPGLRPVVTHVDCDIAKDVLNQVLQTAFEKLRQKKNYQRFSTPLLGLSVTATCDYTGLPAVEIIPDLDGTTHRISAEVKGKLNCYEAAEQRLRDAVNLEEGWQFIRNFDEIGDENISSYLAAIHIDGNGIGRRITCLADGFTNPHKNRDYITQMRRLSGSIENAAMTALQKSIKAVISSIQSKDGRFFLGKEGDGIRIRGKQLPLRPIVFGGDDTTIVCDGRLGLTLAELYVRELTAVPLTDTNRPMSARAGVAIVKTHHPFARAMRLANSLERSAKKHIHECQPAGLVTDGQEISAIDWHIAGTGAGEEIEAIRAREYTVQIENKSYSLNMRPLRLGFAVAGDWHTWDILVQCINTLTNTEWAKRRNKLMILRDMLRKGPDAVKRFQLLHKLPELPNVTSDISVKETGWADNCCTCFDAIETLDFFIPLVEGDKK